MDSGLRVKQVREVENTERQTDILLVYVSQDLLAGRKISH